MENPVATISNITEKYIQTTVSPNMNHYTLEIIYSNAGQSTATTATDANALDLYDDARQALEDAGTPAGN